jgi:hypothetical protein
MLRVACWDVEVIKRPNVVGHGIQRVRDCSAYPAKQVSQLMRPRDVYVLFGQRRFQHLLDALLRMKASLVPKACIER